MLVPPVGAASPAASKLVTVKLFRSLHAGFGDADDVRFTHRMDEYAATDAVTWRYNRIHGSIDARWPGQIRAGMAVTKLSTQSHDLPPHTAISWVDVVNNIYPATYYLVGRKMMKIRFGVVTEVGTNSLGLSNATGGMFDDDGSGIPYLYACFGGVSSNTKLIRMNVAGLFSTTKLDSSAGDVVADKLLSLNGDVYRTITPTGGTANCQVSKCPYGSDRMDSTKWGAGVTVGYAGTSINALVAVNNAPVAIKPEGIFTYNAGLDRWVNKALAWRNFMHLDNGIGAYFLGDSLIVPMGDGGAYIFDGNSTRPFDPGGMIATPNRHTTRDKFAATAAMRHWLLGATRHCAKKILAGSSLQFQTEISSVFTDRSAQVRDSDLTTGATFSIGSTSDHIWVGWTRPFTSVRFDNGLANTVARTTQVAVGTAPGVYSNVTSRDFTALAGATLGQPGDIVLTQDPVAAGWVQTTVNGVTAYWMRLAFSGALTASVQWLNCLISPWYPSVDPTVFPLDGLDKSGIFPHLLFGKLDQGEPTFHDMYSLPEPDDIGAVIFSDAGGTNLNHSRTLLMIGRFCVWQIQIADNDRPGTEPEPFINDTCLIEGASQVPAAEGRLVSLKEIRVHGHEFDPAQVFRFYYAWDYGKAWNRVGPSLTHAPGKLVPSRNIAAGDRGNRFRWACGWKQPAAAALGSQGTVTHIEADFEILPIPLDETQERSTRTQPRF